MINSRLLRFLVSEALLGDLVEQGADRSTLWLWKQTAVAMAFAAWLNTSLIPIRVCEKLVGVLTTWRFDRVWWFASGGAAAFWTLATTLVISRYAEPHVRTVAIGISIGLGATLYSIGRQAARGL
jgi:hypothetical protein